MIGLPRAIEIRKQVKLKGYKAMQAETGMKYDTLKRYVTFANHNEVVEDEPTKDETLNKEIDNIDLGKKTTGTKTVAEKQFVLSAWSEKGYMMDIDEYCLHYKLPRVDIHSYKLVSHTGTPYYNILFKENINETVLEIDFDSIIKKHIKPIRQVIKYTENTDTFDRLVYTDAHIGMTPNDNGFSLYGGKWDEDELYKCKDIIQKTVITNRKSKILYIDDLGDFMDGWNAETVRKGHHLPQNMDNEKAFDVGVAFKVKMVDVLINYYDEIILNNICNDNHSGSFGYVANSAVKSILELKYSNVKVYNHRRFISHYIVGNHAFVISHGKDGKALKFGFKPQLDPKQIEKIDGYLKNNDIYKKADFIEFSKGDSHQLLLDLCTSDDFDYCNYGALSPSSEWVQTNFKKGRSSAMFFNIEYDSNKKSFNPIYFNEK